MSVFNQCITQQSIILLCHGCQRNVVNVHGAEFTIKTARSDVWCVFLHPPGLILNKSPISLM